MVAGAGAVGAAGLATSVPVAAGLVRWFLRPRAIRALVNVHFCIDPGIGVSVKRVPDFFARNETICGDELAVDSPT